MTPQHEPSVRRKAFAALSRIVENTDGLYFDSDDVVVLTKSLGDLINQEERTEAIVEAAIDVDEQWERGFIKATGERGRRALVRLSALTSLAPEEAPDADS